MICFVDVIKLTPYRQSICLLFFLVIFLLIKRGIFLFFLDFGGRCYLAVFVQAYLSSLLSAALRALPPADIGPATVTAKMGVDAIASEYVVALPLSTLYSGTTGPGVEFGNHNLNVFSECSGFWLGSWRCLTGGLFYVDVLLQICSLPSDQTML